MKKLDEDAQRCKKR